MYRHVCSLTFFFLNMVLSFGLVFQSLLIFEKLVIFICATTGQGEEPDSMKVGLPIPDNENSLFFPRPGKSKSRYIKTDFIIEKMSKFHRFPHVLSLVILEISFEKHLAFDSLSRTKIAVFGLGDSSYTR